MSRILVVCYSRTGHTKRVAQKLAAALHADLEIVEDEKTSRRGFVGYMLSALEGLRKQHAPIRPLVHDPAAYDMIVAGTPIWAGRLCAPMRTYLAGVAGKAGSAAFFCTMGGSGGARAFAQMAELTGRPPIATLEITEGELKSGAWSGKTDEFARKVAAAGV